jgi:hypothetical protein
LLYLPRLYKTSDVTTIVGGGPEAEAPGVAVRLTSGVFTPGDNYRVTVTVLSGDVASAPSALSPPFPIIQIPVPTGVTMSVLGQSVLASWQPVATPAGLSGQATYIAQLIAPTRPDSPMAATPALPATSATLTSNAASGGFMEGQQYLVRVRAVFGNYSGAWASSEPCVALAAPVVTTFVYAAPDLFVEWQAVLGADSYEVIVGDAAGAPLKPPLSAIVTPRPNLSPMVELQGHFTAGDVLNVRVRARQGGSIGPWNGPAFTGDDRARLTIQTIPAPTITGVSYAGNAVTVSWSDPNPAAGTGYIVGIVARSGEVVTEYPSPTLATTFNFVPTPGTTGADYVVQVRALTPRNWSLWSAAVPLVS